MPSILIEIDTQEQADYINSETSALGYLYYEIVEGKGLRSAEKMNRESERNFLLIHKENQPHLLAVSEQVF